jgi:hypothetical protein
MKCRPKGLVEAGRFIPNLDEYILDRLFGLCGVTQDANGDRKKRRGDLIVQVRNRLQVSTGHALQQARLLRSGFLSRFWILHNFRPWRGLMRRKRIGTSQLAESSCPSPAPN